MQWVGESEMYPQTPRPEQLRSQDLLPPLFVPEKPGRRTLPGHF